ncbi:MAG: iron-containing alcohol dehydrogenase [Clostridia bacterium]|nr:iron-containing alcohol dehydrogenase [Clostridia bacterium]
MSAKTDMTTMRNFKHLVDFCAENYGDVHFMEYKTPGGVESKTYADLKRCADAFSLFLISKGLKGSHIALIGGASFNWAAAFMGAADCSCAVVPLAPAETDEMNVKLIEFADCEAFVFDSKHLSLFERVKSERPKVRLFVSVDDSGNGNAPDISGIFTEYAGDYNEEPRGDDLCAIMFTSGTTGFPKGVMLTHNNFIATGTWVHEAYPTQRMMGALPFHHAFGLTGNITKTMVNARTLCLNDNLQNLFADFRLYKPNGMLAVPQMIKYMMNGGFRYAKAHPELTEQEAFKEFFGGAFTVISSGSAPLDKDLNDRYNATGVGVYNGYGMTECAPIVANNVGAFYKSGSVGRLIPCMRAKIDDGEILLKGPNVMKGYYKNPEATAEAFTSDGWFKTGDLGYLDGDGYLFITGRRKNLILLDNGENVSAEFLEDKLSRDPVIKECVAYGDNGAIYAEVFPDKDMAAASGVADVKAHVEAFVEKVNGELADFQRIRGVVLRDVPFEKTASQKIKRDVVRSKAKRELVLPSNRAERRVYQAVEEILGTSDISMADDFFTVGGNSLNTTELAVALNLSPQAVYDSPVLSDLAIKADAVSAKEADDRVKNINGIIASTKTDETVSGCKSVLLTGSTGFLGVHILKELVEAGKTVYCLVRDEKRLYSNIKYYFGDFVSPRIIPVTGNIEAKDLGLGDGYNDLASVIDTVFHVAANVHHAGDYADLERTNVQGTRNVIDFCFRANAVLQHTSTVSVHGAATVIEQTENAVFSEDILDIGQRFTDNVYIHSKYKAEEEVLLARSRGLKANIYRIGNLTWRTSDGVFQRNSSDNGFLHRVRAILKLGVYHENMDKYPMDLTAVDECARAYVLLALSGRINRIYHMFNHNFLDVRDMFRMLNVPWRFASTAETIEIMNRNLDDRDIHVYMFYMMISGRSSEVKMINDQTAAELKSLGFTWSVPDRGYLTVSNDGSRGQCLDFAPVELRPAVQSGGITPIGRITLGVLRNAETRQPETLSGENSVLKIKDALLSRGLKKPLFITVPFEIESVKKLISQFENAPVFTDIAAEPAVSDTDNALGLYLTNGCDCVVGIGGGSVLDTAKITALRAANPESFVEDIARLDSECAPAVPLALAPTTAGTGSEATLFAVATEDEKNKKRPFTSDKFLPDIVALDPVLTVSVPKMSTAFTGIDALSHAVESHLSLFAPFFPEDTALAPEAVKAVFDNLETAFSEPKNIRARDAMLNAAHVAGKSFGRAGTGYIHAIAHRFGEFYHVPHGLAIAAAFTPVLRAYLPYASEKMAELARCIGVGTDAGSFIDAVDALITRLGINKYSIPYDPADCFEIARKAQEEAKLVGYPRFFTDAEVRELVDGIFRR